VYLDNKINKRDQEKMHNLVEIGSTSRLPMLAKYIHFSVLGFLHFFLVLFR